MDLGLTNRVVLISGSSRGIGLATADAFLAEGCRTVVTGRDREALAAAEAQLVARHGRERVLAVSGDFTDETTIRDEIERIHDHWGRIEILVANIGSGRGTPGAAPPEAEWTSLFETNLRGSVRLATAVLPDFAARNTGSIVLISSITGVEATRAPLPYSAAKAALISYGNNLARLVGPNNVRVNCVAPGNVLFPGGSWERHLSARRDEVMSHIEAEVPLKRFGRPEEIADVIVFLSSDRASFITGACVVADGGQTRSL